jgi:hypothetical protein
VARHGEHRLGCEDRVVEPAQRQLVPKVSGEFVARMEDVLELYAEPQDEALPAVSVRTWMILNGSSITPSRLSQTPA